MCTLYNQTLYDIKVETDVFPRFYIIVAPFEFIHKLRHPLRGREDLTKFISLFTKMDDNGGGQKYQKMSDVIYGQPPNIFLSTEKCLHFPNSWSTSTSTSIIFPFFLYFRHNNRGVLSNILALWMWLRVCIERVVCEASTKAPWLLYLEVRMTWHLNINH